MSRFHLIVDVNHGVPIFPFQNTWSYCCGPGNSTTGKCIHSTRNSVEPFPLSAGRVIFNRTSGSTLPNITDISSATTTSSTTVSLSSQAASPTITAQPLNRTLCPNTPSSSNKPAVVGVGVGVPSGLALLGTLGLLWKQRARELSAAKEAHVWKERYDEVVERKYASVVGAESTTHELEHWGPNEIDGRLVHEASDRT